MYITPKLSTADTDVPDKILELYEGAVEIQMLSSNIRVEMLSIPGLLKELPETKVLNLHLPFGQHSLVLYLGSAEHRERLVDLMKFMSDVPQVNIVMHCENDIRTLRELRWAETLCDIYAAAGCHAEFLIENTLTNADRTNPDIPDAGVLLAESGDLPFVKGCVDWCHLKASRNLMRMPIQYPTDALGKVTCFHFADAWDADGWKDKGTHGRMHHTYTAFRADVEDLQFKVPMRGDTIFVLEVCESDYRNRPDQCRMLEWAHKYFRE